MIAGVAAAIRGDGSEGRLVEILHDHATLTGFDIAEGDIGVWVLGATGVRISDNVIHELSGNDGYAVKVQREPQRLVCGNEVSGDQGRVTNGRRDPSSAC